MSTNLEEVDFEKVLKEKEDMGEEVETIQLSEQEDIDDDMDDDMGDDMDDLDDDVANDMGETANVNDKDSGDTDDDNEIPNEKKEEKTFVDDIVDDIEDEESSDEDSDDEYTENMQKLEQDINTDVLHSFHPETKQINYKELLTLSNITRNKKGQIIDPLHKTLPFLTRYEKAKILGLRAKQINHGSKPFVTVPREVIDGHTIAYMELKQNAIPFIIRRPMPNGGSEYWKVKDLMDIN